MSSLQPTCSLTISKCFLSSLSSSANCARLRILASAAWASKLARNWAGELLGSTPVQETHKCLQALILALLDLVRVIKRIDIDLRARFLRSDDKEPDWSQI